MYAFVVVKDSVIGNLQPQTEHFRSVRLGVRWSMKTNQLNFNRRACLWWDRLTMTEKVWYGQMYPEYAHKTDLIFKAYEEHLKTGSHLKIVEWNLIIK